ncbi:hypothetical protein FEM48_Zijuj02G0131900 [Ziziphus jujuba var. spinosa]|uniref:DUF7731 domain-containing protein n=1 Tax=Ziziphus jujuba var. spinosa TaxID=714518 RepID=A0A978VVX3_ZIZJJ|nr:hypothetical protein FEM48_Zijuj02G0131900 [Ziziphus jujuba var. spinosa]
MAFPILPKHKLLVCILISVGILCPYPSYADENNVGQMFEKALMCFNNKFIYAGCDEAYRLNEGGNINVPPEALNLFCNGPCLTETELVLKCIDSMFSNFMFYNKATVHDIRDALRSGCSYTRQRGNPLTAILPNQQSSTIGTDILTSSKCVFV